MRDLISKLAAARAIEETRALTRPNEPRRGLPMGIGGVGAKNHRWAPEALAGADHFIYTLTTAECWSRKGFVRQGVQADYHQRYIVLSVSLNEVPGAR